MWRTLLGIMTLTMIIGAIALSAGMTRAAVQDQAVQTPTNPTVRIGVYDSRAIAIAYASSQHNSVADKMAEYEQAKAVGDEERARELEAWGLKRQRQLHRQGFGRVPVSDLLAHVSDQLPALAEQLDLDAIVFECNHHGEHVEVVDVTLDLVRLYDPSERTLTWVADLADVEPIDLDTIDYMRNID